MNETSHAEEENENDFCACCGDNIADLAQGTVEEEAAYTAGVCLDDHELILSAPTQEEMDRS